MFFDSLIHQEGNTPLHLAALQGYLDISKVLIKKGANVNATNKVFNFILLDSTFGYNIFQKYSLIFRIVLSYAIT